MTTRFKNLFMAFLLFVFASLSIHTSADAAGFINAMPSSTARNNHFAVLLQNGKVLVIDDTMEIYDPATNLWSPVPNMTIPRKAPGVLLPNGKVLVISGGPTLTTAELYDPATNSWSGGGTLTVGRSDFTATLLKNGKVLVVGGIAVTTGAVCTGTSELYDPATNSWSTVNGTLATPRAQHTATLLNDGKVLVAAGVESGPSIIQSAEVYDPDLDSWSDAKNTGLRHFHTATLLPDGRVLVAGGRTGGDVGTTAASIYDPETNDWSAARSSGGARYTHTATLLPNGRVLITGGYNSGVLSTTEIYDPITNTWSGLAPSADPASPILLTARNGHTATLLPNGQVFVVGGTAGTSTELFDYTVNSWNLAASLATERQKHTATLLPNGKVLVAGGASASGDATGKLCELFDPATNLFSPAGPLTTSRSGHTATLLSSGKVLAVGGTNAAGAVSTAELYDPATNKWNPAGTLKTGRSDHTATFLPNGRILVAGGFNSSALNSAELYDPVTNSWSDATSFGAARFKHSATLLPNGTVLIAGGNNGSTAIGSAALYNPATDLWSSPGSLSAARYEHSATLLPNGRVLVAGGQSGGNALSSAEIFNPGTSLWAPAGVLGSARFSHAAVLLPTGQVLVSGGDNSGAIVSSEVYSPITNLWTASDDLNEARRSHTLTLLLSGKFLAAGGSNANVISSAEVFDVGLNYLSQGQPTIDSANTPVDSGEMIAVSGTKFTGLSEASGGGYNSSATNYPLVKIRSLVNERGTYLLSSSLTDWSSSSFTSAAISGLQPGPATLTLVVNGIPSASRLIQITNQAGLAPSITGQLTATGSVGQLFNYVVFAINNPNTYDATGLPNGLSIDTDTGVISGTPTATSSGDVILKATNANGTATAILTLTITSQAPSITSPLTATGTVGQDFSYTITASGQSPISYTASPLPLGLTLNGSTISGKPSFAAVTNITLTAANSSGIPDSETLVLTVSPVGAPHISSDLFVVTTINTQFTYPITVTGNDPITITVDGLPSSLSLASNTISGQLNTLGLTNVTLTASNAIGTDVQVLKIMVNSLGAPEITSAEDAFGRQGTPFTFNLTAIGEPTITYSSSTLPTGLILDANTGAITGTPTVNGNFSVTISASNSKGIDTKPLNIGIKRTNAIVPEIVDLAISRNPARTGTDVTFTATALPTPPPVLSFSWTFFSNGVQDGPVLDGNPVTRQFSKEGQYFAVVRASDGFDTSQQSQPIEVLPLEPNIGGTGSNITSGTTVTNPIDGVQVFIGDSLAGVLDIDLSSGSPASRANDFFETKIPGRAATFSGNRGADKYTKPGIYVVEVRRKDSSGVETGKARRMLPISEKETGAGSSVTDPVSRAVGSPQVKGKINFTAGKSDLVTLSCTLKVPGGVDFSGAQTVSVGIGNIVEDVVVNKGKGAPIGSVSKFSLKVSRLPKNKVTVGGEDAKITMTLKQAGLADAGLDTEGITNVPIDKKNPAQRSIQSAFVIGGVSYFGQVDVNYSNAKDVGTMVPTRARR